MNTYANFSKTFIATLVVIILSGGQVFCYPPDNAAVLYYKAFMMDKDVSEEVKDNLDKAIKGEEKLSEDSKKYIADEAKTIKVLIEGAEVADCDWGYDYSEGFEMVMPPLAEIRRASKLVLADAIMKAENGDYKTALDRCISTYKIAKHVKETVIISNLVGIAIESLTNETVKHIVSKMPADEKLLIILRDSLSELSDDTVLMQKCMTMEAKLVDGYINKEKIPVILEAAGGSIEQLKGVEITDELLNKSMEYYTKHMKALTDAMDKEYIEAFTTMKEIQEQMQKDIEEKKPEAFLSSIMAPAIEKAYNVEIASKAGVNALRSALEVYLIKAKTGKLPDRLPAGIAKDLFSGKVFLYEKTEEGFVLKCQGKDMLKDKIHEYEFKVK